MSKSGDEELKSQGENKCAYWLPKKSRSCTGRPIPGTRFCGNHRSNALDDRIPCPLDPNHTVAVSDLSSHLRRCPSARQAHEIESQSFFSRGVNSIGDDSLLELTSTLTSNEKRSKILKLSEVEFSLLVKKICELFTKEMKHIGELKTNVLRPKEFDELFESEKIRGIPYSEKHAIQQASIVGNMAEFGLLSQVGLIESKSAETDLNSELAFVEFGAGRGYLSQIICDFCNGTSFVLVDRRGYKFKADRSLRKTENVHVERVRADIADLELSELSFLKGKKFVGLSKHLCGSATDLTIRCCLNVLQTKKVSKGSSGIEERSGASAKAEIGGPKLKGMAIATCCHHLCSWKTYSNRSYFARHGFSPIEFEMLTWFTSWALSGPNKAAAHTASDEGTTTAAEASTSTKRQKWTTDEDHGDKTATDERGPRKPWGTLSLEERKHLGSNCKALIDLGRLDCLKAAGLEAEIVKYVDSSVSPENNLILARLE